MQFKTWMINQKLKEANKEIEDNKDHMDNPEMIDKKKLIYKNRLIVKLSKLEDNKDKYK